MLRGIVTGDLELVKNLELAKSCMPPPWHVTLYNSDRAVLIACLKLSTFSAVRPSGDRVVVYTREHIPTDNFVWVPDVRTTICFLLCVSGERIWFECKWPHHVLAM
jgi:hypothetical protein